MTETITKCPHCGFESEDDEMCRACGELFEEIPPSRGMSFLQTISSFFSWLKSGDFRMIEHDETHLTNNNPENYHRNDDILIDPAFSNILSNIFCDTNENITNNDPENYYQNDDILTNPAFSDIPGNVFYDTSLNTNN